MHKYVNEDGVFQDTLDSGRDFKIRDDEGNDYIFRIDTFILAEKLCAEAIEVKEDYAAGHYHFRLMFDPGTDPEVAEINLIKKIRENVNERCLVMRDGELAIGKDRILKGRIAWSGEAGSQLIIDGKRITMDKFSRMISVYEGFNFEFKIDDDYDVVD